MAKEENKKSSPLGKGLKSFFYTFSANALQLIVSAVIVLVIPKFYGVQEYSYWQLYLLYFSYVGLLQFGWIEGVYLRYAGKKYENLGNSLLATQFVSLIGFYIVTALIFFCFLNIFFPANFNTGIVLLSLVSGLIDIPRKFLFYILQVTNRIKKFAKLNMVDRFVFLAVLITTFSLGFRSFESIIISELIGKMISMLLTIYSCKEIVFNKFVSLKLNIKESFENINAGIKLLIANIASSLIIGIARFGIEQNWGIEIFGKISLTLSISNLLMVFIHAIGVVIFPIVKDVPVIKLAPLYDKIRTILMIPLFFMLTFYYPVKTILSLWLPQYSESLDYMALLFPIVIFQSKISLLSNTYLKVLRKEKQMLYFNLATVILSLILTFVCIFVFHSLTLIVISIVVLLAFCSIISEVYISHLININMKKDILLESVMSLIFMITSWSIQGILGILIYLIFYCVYLFAKRTEIKSSLIFLKRNK